jgi:hypothetical protein
MRLSWHRVKVAHSCRRVIWMLFTLFPFRDEAGVRGCGVHDFLVEGGTPHERWIVFKTKELRKEHFVSR